MDSAASTAPPPGTTVLDSNTLFTTHIASCIERSISSNMKSFAPLRIMEEEERDLGLGIKNEANGYECHTSNFSFSQPTCNPFKRKVKMTYLIWVRPTNLV